jgi:hypothetical protein
MPNKKPLLNNRSGKHAKATAEQQLHENRFSARTVKVKRGDGGVRA